MPPDGSVIWDKVKAVVPKERALMVSTAAAVTRQAKGWLRSMEDALKVSTVFERMLC